VRVRMILYFEIMLVLWDRKISVKEQGSQNGR